MTEPGQLVDQFLELMLPCKDELEYQRCLVTFGAVSDQSPVQSLKNGEQLLRRRSNWRSEYQAGERTRREGLPFTWVESRVITWALSDSPEGKGVASPEYLAELLQRSVDEVSKDINRRQTEQMGIKGLW